MKGRTDWFDGIDELVHAAGCIASNNKSPNGGMIYNIDEFFSGWRKEHIKKRMIALYGGKANLSPIELPNPERSVATEAQSGNKS